MGMAALRSIARAGLPPGPFGLPCQPSANSQLFGLTALPLPRRINACGGGLRRCPCHTPTSPSAPCPAPQEKRTRRGSAPLRVLERSIFSDRMVFVRAMHEAGRMESWELQLYDTWWVGGGGWGGDGG